jgi:hypothetical protein
VTVENQIAEAVAVRIGEELDRLRGEVADLRQAVERGPQPERLMSRKQASEWLACSTRTIDAMIARGAPVVRLGGRGGSPRIRASEWLAWLSASEEVAAE